MVMHKIALIHTVVLSLSKGAYRLDALRQAQGYGVVRSKVIKFQKKAMR
jgi:hypothetical protein